MRTVKIPEVLQWRDENPNVKMKKMSIYFNLCSPNLPFQRYIRSMNAHVLLISRLKPSKVKKWNEKETKKVQFYLSFWRRKRVPIYNIKQNSTVDIKKKKKKLTSLLLFIKTTQIVPQNKTKKKLKKQLPWKEQNKKSYRLIFEETSILFSYLLAPRDEETKTWYKKPKNNFLCSLVIREFEEISGFQGPDRFYWYLKFSSKLWS